MFDLSEDIGKFVDQKEVNEMRHVLQWLIHQNPAGSSLKEAVSGSEFVVASEEVLFQIAISPYATVVRTAAAYDHGVVIACANLKGLSLIFAYLVLNR